MPLTDSQKLDFLWKKIMYGVAETSVSDKAGPNESIASPLPIYGHTILAQSGSISAIPPVSSDTIVQVYSEGTANRCKVDGTVSGNHTWVTVADYNATIDVTNQLGDWIPPTFNSLYQVKVYAGNPSSGGILLNPLTTDQEWVFDYTSGVLHFPNTVPSGVATNGVYIEGYRYIGTKGASGGVSSFIALTDGPGAFTGHAGQGIVVNSGADGLSYTSGRPLEIFTATLNFDSSGNVTSVTGLPTGWTIASLNVISTGNTDITLQHTVGRPPTWVTFWGASTVNANEWRLRYPTTVKDVIYTTANAASHFKLASVSPSLVGTGTSAGANSAVVVMFF
jgi:hypothetical protein